MIVGESFLWLHLPKTGGTTMNKLLRDKAIPGVVVDPDDTPAKHDSICLRESKGGWRAGNRKRFITTRRLENWLVSDWNHKRRHMGIENLDFEPVRSGLFYSLRLGGVWVAADWWLNYFEVDDNVSALRLEHLLVDINKKLLPYLPEETEVFSEVPMENIRPSVDSNEGVEFTEEDKKRIWRTNPIWRNWENKNYEGVICQ